MLPASGVQNPPIYGASGVRNPQIYRAFGIDIEAATLNNTEYRKILFTTDHSQLILMTISPGGDIDREVHPNSDQFIRFESGTVEVAIYDSLTAENPVQVLTGKDGFSIVIPAGRYHYVKNIGDDDLKLYALYMPPFHPAPRGEAVTREEIAELEGKSISYLAISK